MKCWNCGTKEKCFVKCEICGKIISRCPAKQKSIAFCSNKCRGVFKTQRINYEGIEILYKQGMTWQEIANQTGISKRAVGRKLKKLGIESRARLPRKLGGEYNNNWKGDGAGYHAFHKRVYSIKGKPQECDICGREDPDKKYEWANLTGKYQDPNDYQRLCCSCHRNYDNERRSNGTLNESPRSA